MSSGELRLVSALRIASARDCFFLLPPPLWGRVGVGVAASPVYVAYPLSSPPPQGGTTERGSLYRSTKRLHLSIRVKHPAAGFRQRKGREEEQGVGRHRKDRDGIGERRRGRERADQERKQRADAAAEIVAKTLARSAQPGRIEFGQERADPGEIPGSKEAERETKQPQHLVGQWQLGVEQHHGDRPDREDQEQVAPSDAVGKPGADQVTDKGADDQRREIAGGADHRELALGGEEARHPEGNGIIAA